MIILIGFKHVGKSTIGKMLAEKLSLPLIDLDREIEARHAAATGETMACRQIYELNGKEMFRSLEHETLTAIIALGANAILSLGGGTPNDQRNQAILRGNTLVHITSPKEVVYERIMLSGKPAFLSPDENSYDSFSRVWEERRAVYEDLATITIENNGSLIDAVDRIIASTVIT